MTTEDKALAFETLADAFTNYWEDKTWSWWCPNPAGGKKCDTRSEAVADLLRWCREYVRVRRKKMLNLPDVPPPETPPCGST